jgi:predicted transcriptional regulator
VKQITNKKTGRRIADKTTSFQIDPQMDEKLDQAAVAINRSRSFVVREALAEYFDRKREAAA